MSADNWGVCPRCRVAHEQDLLARAKEVDAAYGKVAPTEYDGLRRQYAAFAETRPEETFREDYEIGMNTDGTFSVDYHGRCETCGLKHVFKHTDRVLTAREDAS